MSKPIALSAEQKAAVEFFGKDLGVSAGAGSGKTTVLVERYLEAIGRHGVRPENILAITFTDKAANVMKERLRGRCEGLEGAWIGTIHSFCARFLKENPIECGVDPLFSVLGAGEQEMMLERSLDRLFEESASDEGCLSLLADFDEKAIRTALKNFYDLRRSYDDDDRFFAVPDPKQRSAEAEQQLSALCEELVCGSGSSEGPEGKLKDAARMTLEALRVGGAGWARLEAVTAPSRALDRRSVKTKEKVNALKECAENWSAWQLQLLGLDQKKHWMRLLRQFAEIYDGEKRRQGTYDFEDLLCFVHQALSCDSPKAAALKLRAQRQFRFIFVDEYQDTSLLQAKIISHLKSEGNLFVVGDSRQSIYRFRHAHPEIFLGALERSEKRSLIENYRSRPEILDLANKIFGPLFGEPYEKLIPRHNFKNKKTFCVEMVEIPKDERSLDALRVIEARTLASRVREMVDGGFRVEEGGRERPVRYRDFALLLRKSTASRLYEQELEAFSIPYFVNKGRGFYEKTEVMDLVNFLRILENPSENIAMASVLRSPLVQVTDDALFWLSRRRLSAQPEASLHAALLGYESIRELADDDRRRIAEFLTLFVELRSQKDRIKMSELLQTVLVRTAYESKVLTREEGGQAQANIWKLVAMASQVEDKNIRDISDLIFYIKSLSESPEREAEARMLGEDEDVLRILTIHAAKGMEFPCVLIADMGAQERAAGRPPFLYTPNTGLGAKIKDPAGDDFFEDASYRAALEEDAAGEAQESDRLLYVAMTRAKEHLILSGVGGQENTWIGRVSQWMDKLSFPFHRVPVVLRRAGAAPKEDRFIDIWLSAPPKNGSKELLTALVPRNKAYEALEDLTVSRIMEVAAPAWKGVEEDVDGDQEELDEEAMTPRNEFGTVFHRVMEVSAIRSPRGALSAARFRELTQRLTEKERQEAREAFDLFWRSEIGETVRLSKKCYPELPFLYKTKRGLLKGQMDLVYGTKGSWSILDYKTGRTPEALSLEKYRWQMGLYALAFRRLSGETASKTALYFTRTRKTVEWHWTEPMLEAVSVELEKHFQDIVLGERA